MKDMSELAVAVLDLQGRLITCSSTSSMPYSKIQNAVRMGYDIFRTIDFIVRELGYETPKNVSVKTEDLELTVFRRRDKVVVAMIYEPSIPVSINGNATASMEA